MFLQDLYVPELKKRFGFWRVIETPGESATNYRCFTT